VRPAPPWTTPLHQPPTRIMLPPRKLSQRELLENEHAAKTQLREAAAANRRRASNYKHQMSIRGQLDNSGFEGEPAPVTTLASLRSWLDAGNKVALAAPLCQCSNAVHKCGTCCCHTCWALRTNILSTLAGLRPVRIIIQVGTALSPSQISSGLLGS